MTAAVESPRSESGARVPEASRADWFSSYDVNAFEVPTGREEIWRFTPMKRLAGLHEGAQATGAATVEIDAPGEFTVETVARGDKRLGEAGTPADRVAAQAFSSFAEATILTAAKEQRASAPTTVKVTGPGEGKLAYGHLQIRAELYAEAVVVIDHRGSGVYADNVEFVLAEGSKLTVVSIQDWADDAVHVSAQHAKIGKDAVLKHTVVTLGGDLVRVSPTASFAERGGEVDLTGLYFADAGQHFEHRTFVDHAQPNCTSNVTYKGALQGEGAHTVWIGDVLIRVAAEGTQTYELNRNLLLTDGARADSVPNLEIETGEIAGAGHASATGRFDDEQLFYLQARGIPEDQARRLVVRGFFHELLMKITVPEVRERLEAAIEAELEAVGV
ncbi:Iron-regulated ABC transporter permease protein SufD [Actinokineospora alba]|uniref:Iron-regulated ABC transporter permease protein SufD n=1 Tax=Actinokineospora alba TaxID=504798 RepID=A0A1H0VUR4_9PSEU|nr:Fe-S cluster assembly protein SufD [Actinokineospora alba]TDP70079.1 Fe-S cluster assembly protein SufD [Actinokineospora alba]SDI39495.1 Fe-S cluster assembly protein SufD [Actinokineospora alba]SDP81948.1 Iron-regulated ABC transporter permease protein SufD [Actinokineospora alba]